MATKKLNYHQNLQQNEIQNGVDQNLSSAPSSPKEGQFYWNTSTKEDMIYNGTAWVSRTSQGKVYTAGNGINTTSFASDQIAVYDASTSQKGIIEIATDSEASTGTDTSRAVTPKQLATKVTANNAITAGTGTVINYDTKGLVTSSSNIGIDSGSTNYLSFSTSTYKISANVDTAVGTNTNYLVTSGAVKTYVDGKISSTYKPAGSVAFADRPSLSASIVGNVYNITDAFTTTSDFVEGAGNNYPAGTNIVCINTTGTTYKWDVLAGFIDLSGYQLANTAVTHTASTAVGSATQPVYIASNGVATATTYSLAKSVPADAVFTDTTYSVFTGATGSAAGTSGLVKAPASGDNTKFLKGDCTWAEALENTATGLYSLTIQGTSTAAQFSINMCTGSSIVSTTGRCVAIGYNTAINDTAGKDVAIGYSADTRTESVAVGCDTKARGYSVAIGCDAEAYKYEGDHNIAIGHSANAAASYAIQLGSGINTEDNSFYVAVGAGTNYNYKMLGSDGIIPNARLNLDTTPTSASGNPITSGAVYTAITGMAKKLVATNPALTVSGGQVTWEITNTLGTDECGVFIKEVSSNEYVEAYYEVTASKVTIKMNTSTNVTAGTYKAIIIG